MIFLSWIIALIIDFPMSESFATLILFLFPTVADKIYSLSIYKFNVFPSNFLCLNKISNELPVSWIVWLMFFPNALLFG